MQYTQTSLFKSPCEKAMIFVENDLPIGVFHDFLMMVKGAMVERMVKAHKEQVAEMQDQEVPEQEEKCQSAYV